MMIEPLHCAHSGNPCGTDTWGNGQSCPCSSCQKWLLAFNAGVEAAALSIEEVARRSIGRAVAPLDIPWLAERLRTLKGKPSK